MKKFLIIYAAPIGAAEKMAQASPEEMKAGMEPWMKWGERVGDKMVDMGMPVGNAHQVNRDGASTIESPVVGYSFINAENMDEALELVKGHPHLDWMEEAKLKVYECMPMPGME